MEPTKPTGDVPTNEKPGDMPEQTPDTNVTETVSEPTQPVAQPAETPTPVVAGKGNMKKKWLVPAVVAAGIVVLAGGYAFGFYLPNRPEAVYNKAMSQSGSAVDKLVSYAQTQTSAEYAGASLDGTMAVKTAGVSFDATMKGKMDDKNADVTLAANIAGEKVNVDLRTIDADKSDNPDMYVKVSGVKSFLDGAGMGELSSLDGQWIGIDHTLLDTYQKQLESLAGASASGLPTAEQVDDAIAKAQVVNKEYLFTTDKDKAVVAYKSFVGKETKNGRSVNHYKVGYDKNHLKAYVTALGKALDSSKLNDWVKDQNDGKSISALLKANDIDSATENLKGDETVDLYVDTATKLVQSIVFTDKSADNPGTLTIAQNYTGGDTYPFQIAADFTKAEEPGTMTLDLSTNTKTNKVVMNMKLDIKSNDPMSLDMTVNITPSKDKVEVSAPSGAKSVNEILQQFGLDPSMFTGAADPYAMDESSADLLNTVNL